MSTKTEGWAKVPESVIRKLECTTCFRLWCFLDLKSGKQKFLVRSARYIAKQLEMKPQTVLTHLRHLEGAGYVRLSQGAAHGSIHVDLIHNPARGRRQPVSPVKGVRRRAKPAPTAAPPQRPSGDEPAAEPDRSAVPNPAPPHASAPNSKRGQALYPGGAQTDEADVPESSTDAFPSGERPPVPRSGTGSSSAGRSEKVCEDREQVASSVRSLKMAAARNEIEQHLLDQGSPAKVATEIASEVLADVPFREGDLVDPEELRLRMAKARGHLRYWKEKQQLGGEDPPRPFQ